jgi:hypothetical protein
MLSSIFNPFEPEFKSYHDDLDLAAKDVQLQISLASKKPDRETVKLLGDDRKEMQDTGDRLSNFKEP